MLPLVTGVTETFNLTQTINFKDGNIVVSTTPDKSVAYANATLAGMWDDEERPEVALYEVKAPVALRAQEQQIAFEPLARELISQHNVLIEGTPYFANDDRFIYRLNDDSRVDYEVLPAPIDPDSDEDLGPFQPAIAKITVAGNVNSALPRYTKIDATGIQTTRYSVSSSALDLPEGLIAFEVQLPHKDARIHHKGEHLFVTEYNHEAFAETSLEDLLAIAQKRFRALHGQYERLPQDYELLRLLPGVNKIIAPPIERSSQIHEFLAGTREWQDGWNSFVTSSRGAIMERANNELFRQRLAKDACTALMEYLKRPNRIAPSVVGGLPVLHQLATYFK